MKIDYNLNNDVTLSLMCYNEKANRKLFPLYYIRFQNKIQTLLKKQL